MAAIITRRRPDASETAEPGEPGDASIGTIAGNWLEAYPDLDPAHP